MIENYMATADSSKCCDGVIDTYEGKLVCRCCGEKV